MRSASEGPPGISSGPGSSGPSVPPPDAHDDFSALVRSQLDFVWRLLRRLGLSSADADDAAQEVFVVAARRQDQLVNGRERSFLYGTAVRVASNRRRSAVRRREAPEELAPETSEDAPWADELVERTRARALLDELLAKLPDELARVLVLSEVEQLTLAAIADLEDIPPGTAASRLRRARAALRELLEQHRDRNPFAGEP